MVEALDLGNTYLANNLTDGDDIDNDQFPLCLCYCQNCKNLQLNYFVDAETLYKKYMYVTPNSSMLERHYAFLLQTLLDQKYLTRDSRVAEIGSNAGQFLRILTESVELAVGIEPATNIVEMEQNLNLNVHNDFFNIHSASRVANQFGKMNCIVARHCFAHNENPGDMIEAADLLLDEHGVMVIENAYALNTILNGEFDQIYHEHMYYYTLSSLDSLFNKYGFELVDATIGEVHGGSVIAVAARKDKMKKSNSLANYLYLEDISLNVEAIDKFTEQSRNTISKLKLLIEHLKKSGAKIYSYGATAKGNTLLNSLNLRNSEIEVCVDSTDLKHGKYLPGSGIQVVSELYGEQNPPDYYLLTAWNYKSEIVQKVRSTGNYTTKFIIPFPSIHIV